MNARDYGPLITMAAGCRSRRWRSPTIIGPKEVCLASMTGAVAGLSVRRTDPPGDPQGAGHPVLGLGVAHVKVVRHDGQFVPFFPVPCDEKKSEVHLQFLGNWGEKAGDEGHRMNFHHVAINAAKAGAHPGGLRGLVEYNERLRQDLMTQAIRYIERSAIGWPRLTISEACNRSSTRPASYPSPSQLFAFGDTLPLVA